MGGESTLLMLLQCISSVDAVYYDYHGKDIRNAYVQCGSHTEEGMVQKGQYGMSVTVEILTL